MTILYFYLGRYLVAAKPKSSDQLAKYNEAMFRRLAITV